jgi:hypothetical protein
MGTSLIYLKQQQLIERVILVYIILFQNFLDAFTEAAESSFGCLFVDDKIVVATRKWWNLSAKLIQISLYTY